MFIVLQKWVFIFNYSWSFKHISYSNAFIGFWRTEYKSRPPAELDVTVQCVWIYLRNCDPVETIMMPYLTVKASKDLTDVFK